MDRGVLIADGRHRHDEVVDFEHVHRLESGGEFDLRDFVPCRVDVGRHSGTPWGRTSRRRIRRCRSRARNNSRGSPRGSGTPSCRRSSRLWVVELRLPIDRGKGPAAGASPRALGIRHSTGCPPWLFLKEKREQSKQAVRSVAPKDVRCRKHSGADHSAPSTGFWHFDGCDMTIAGFRPRRPSAAVQAERRMCRWSTRSAASTPARRAAGRRRVARWPLSSASPCGGDFVERSGREVRFRGRLLEAATAESDEAVAALRDRGPSLPSIAPPKRDEPGRALGRRFNRDVDRVARMKQETQKQALCGQHGDPALDKPRRQGRQRQRSANRERGQTAAEQHGQPQQRQAQPAIPHLPVKEPPGGKAAEHGRDHPAQSLLVADVEVPKPVDRFAPGRKASV